MFEWQGTWFPDGEQHLPEWMGKMRQMRDGVPQYQYTKYLKALEFVKQRRTAVDVGGNVGLWSRNMAKDFSRLEAFEPVETYRECWRRNVMAENAALHDVALGEESGVVSLCAGTAGSFGDTFVTGDYGQGNAARNVPLRTLDSFELHDVDFVKIDCEGYELFVLRGAERTIRLNKPCIIVEQKPGHAQKYGLGETDAVQLLRGWGARVRAVMAGDYILSW